MKLFSSRITPAQRALYWVIYLLILLNVLILDWTLTSVIARSDEGVFYDTGMTRTEFLAHMDTRFEEIVDAIYIAEGGSRAKKPFGILSVPCGGYFDCRKVCKNTVRNNYIRWIKAGRPGEYIVFLGGRYAPVEAHRLNRHWVGNVKAIIHKKLS